MTDWRGRFQLMTFRIDDGAVAGEHKVFITKQIPEPADKDKPYPHAISLLPNRYGSPVTTPLRATITPGGHNDFHFTLDGLALPPRRVRQDFPAVSELGWRMAAWRFTIACCFSEAENLRLSHPDSPKTDTARRPRLTTALTKKRVAYHAASDRRAAPGNARKSRARQSPPGPPGRGVQSPENTRAICYRIWSRISLVLCRIISYTLWVFSRGHRCNHRVSVI